MCNKKFYKWIKTKPAGLETPFYLDSIGPRGIDISAVL